MASVSKSPIKILVRAWFKAQHWRPFSFQTAAWQGMQAGKCGIIHANTGTGKTYAAWLGALQYCLLKPKSSSNAAAQLQVLWLTPLRALAVDTETALRKPLLDLQLDWQVETRTGDTPSKLRARQNRRLPDALITTPESLTLLLSRARAQAIFDQLQIIIIDEWHQLLGSKRGVQTELALARLRAWRPDLLIWGLSATLPDVPTALHALLGNRKAAADAITIEGKVSKPLKISALIPPTMERFPWAGHLGLKLLPQLLPHLERAQSSLIFTNTRAQTELWYQALLKIKPDWAGRIALHHSSLTTQVRHWVEAALRAGELRCVVCTSSMDLGVDYSPVELSVQIGSPKNIARLLQRAGRSGHQPKATSQIICVPTNALELLEIAAAKAAIAAQHLEPLVCLDKPFDVLVQHLITMALGDGFIAAELLAEIKTTHSYRDLTDAEWQWALQFVTTGGAALHAYPGYHKVSTQAGRYVIINKTVALRHRLVMGTIVSETEVPVRYVKGGYLGQVEEGFIARLRPKDSFLLAGKLLEFVRVHNNIAYVRRATKPRLLVPRWQGQRLALSANLSAYLKQQWQTLATQASAAPELVALQPIIQLQAAWSRLPSGAYLLVEQLKTRDGYHLFFYPLEGRAVHEGLAALCAYRLTQRAPVTLAIAINDYGFELVSATEIKLDATVLKTLLSPINFAQDLIASVNLGELAKRRFREIANIAGLVFKGYPSNLKSSRQLQVSTSLLYDVFKQFDADNLLLQQAWQEVLSQQLESARLRAVLQRLQAQPLVITTPPQLTPLAFPIAVDRLRHRLSSEKLADRVQRMVQGLEKAAN